MAKNEMDRPNARPATRPPEPKPPLNMQQRHKRGARDLMANPHGDGPVRKELKVGNNQGKTY